MAVVASVLRICVGVSAGLACTMSAATPAAWGAAADVPKNELNPDTVVEPPSGATKSTLLRSSGAARRVPLLANRMGVPPEDEKFSMSGGLTPKRGVLV